MSLITLDSKPTATPSSGSTSVKSGEELILRLNDNQGVSPYATVYSLIAKAGEEDFDRVQGNGAFLDQGPDAENELAVAQPESSIPAETLAAYKGQKITVRLEILNGDTSTYSEERQVLVE